MSILRHLLFKYIFVSAFPLKVGNACLNLSIHTPASLSATWNWQTSHSFVF